MNPDIYFNPTMFDPTRFSPDRLEDKKQTHAFLGWGAGEIDTMLNAPLTVLRNVLAQDPISNILSSTTLFSH